MSTARPLSDAPPDAAQLTAWKAQHGELCLLEINGRTAYLRAPKRAQLVRAATRHKNAPVRMLVYLLHSCWLGGAAELKVKDNGQETPLFRAVIERMGHQLNIWADSIL